MSRDPLWRQSEPGVQGATVRMEPVSPEVRALRAEAQLRQQVWEASQHLSAEQIEQLVSAVLDEIRSDEP